MSSLGRTVQTTHTRSLDYTRHLTVAQMSELMDAVPREAEVKFVHHRADPRDFRESDSYSVSVTWKDPT